VNQGANRLYQLVEGWGRFALGDMKTHLFKVLPYYLEHKGVGIGLLEAPNALIGEEPINAGEATKAFVHCRKQCSISLKTCQTRFP
jgi:hypothetical protein